jgi:hypothetical protein
MLETVCRAAADCWRTVNLLAFMHREDTDKSRQPVNPTSRFAA